MKYKLTKVMNHTQRSYGKYVAKAVHDNTVTAKQLEKEIQRNCGATIGDCTRILCELSEVLKQHLQAGDKVVLPYLGTVKLEIDSMAVDSEEDFNVRTHVKGLRVHLLPKSHSGSIPLYDGTNITKVKE